MKIISSDHENCRVVSVCENRIDAAVAIRFKEAFRAQTGGKAYTIILDLSQVEFIDSSGLGAIVAAMKHLGPDRRLDLAGLNPAVDTVFQLTRMDSVFRLFKTLQSAIDACAS